MYEVGTDIGSIDSQTILMDRLHFDRVFKEGGTRHLELDIGLPSKHLHTIIQNIQSQFGAIDEIGLSEVVDDHAKAVRFEESIQRGLTLDDEQRQNSQRVDLYIEVLFIQLL